MSNTLGSSAAVGFFWLRFGCDLVGLWLGRLAAEAQKGLAIQAEANEPCSGIH